MELMKIKPNESGLYTGVRQDIENNKSSGLDLMKATKTTQNEERTIVQYNENNEKMINDCYNIPVYI